LRDEKGAIFIEYLSPTSAGRASYQGDKLPSAAIVLAGGAGARPGHAIAEIAVVLRPISDHPASRLCELLPWNWKAPLPYWHHEHR
jgi:hypothetical protein